MKNTGKILVAVFILLAVALLVMVTIGLFLPAEHSYSRNVHFIVPAEEVWEVIYDFASQPKWREDLVDVKRLPDDEGKEIWRETYKDGKVLNFETTEADPPLKLVRTIVGDVSGYQEKWEFRITALSNGGRIAITVHGEIGNPLIRFLSRYVFGYDASISSYMQQLRKRLGK